MRWLLPSLFLAGFLVSPAAAASSKIAKVLPHLLDAQGLHTTRPSLFERDLYQARLRQNPALASGLRFDIRWKSTAKLTNLPRLQLEVRGSKEPQILKLDQTIEHRPWYQRWSSFTLDEPTFRRMGELIAWRVTLWDGERLLAEQKSFLW